MAPAYYAYRLISTLVVASLAVLMSTFLHFITLVIRTRAILIVFEKITRACFSQIALETMLLPIQITMCNT